MTGINALTAANTLTQAALPLIESATAPQAQNSTTNPGPSPSTGDTVSISNEAKTLHSHHK
ncbi:MAG: hypothetical protein KC563_03895 [Nitrospira sp.]|nr:hypothetical protein [Nitrospira sp.]MCB9710127.1 hypothetical protein [Nitrospiraceae bacterium]MDR4488484.1 hypothetical protein [Nitrospirales bacterium]MCA9467202.1 hypothetical protein [Nitrospira sp.]MCA9474939.1 hypothetical protein [Nitrospira sp.]